MKLVKTFAIAFALVGALAHSLHAQAPNDKWMLGLSAGPTLTNVSGDFVRQSDWAWGLLIGGYVEFAAHKNFGVELGLNFLQKGTELGQTSQGDFGSLRLRYIEFPLLATGKIQLTGDWTFNVFGGGALGLNLSCDVKGIGNVWVSCQEGAAVGDAESVEWSVPFGGGFEYISPWANSAFVIDVRYVLGLTDIFSDVDLKTRTWEFLARWQFGI